MRKHRFALIITVYAIGIAIAITLFVTSSTPSKGATSSWKSSVLVVSQVLPTTPDKDLISQVMAQRKTFYNDLVAQETAALTYLAAVNRLNAQEKLASQMRPGPTSRVSTTTTAPVVSGGNLPAIFSCIIQHESGGNPTAMNSSGAAGLFQDMPSTWGGYDGYSSAADAPASVQYQFNEQLYAQEGLRPWTGDPCVG